MTISKKQLNQRLDRNDGRFETIDKSVHHTAQKQDNIDSTETQFYGEERPVYVVRRIG
jgi:hypothetical protein